MDNEVKGGGNSYTTEFRQLDPRLGRWLSIDPKVTSMPWQSPYCSMDNNPIWFNDQKGDSVGIDETFQKDHAKMKSLEEMVKSKEGRDFLSKYAMKGQTIAGHTFTEDGEYHKKGIDLIYKRDNLENWEKDESGKLVNTGTSGGGQTGTKLKQETVNGVTKTVGATITVTMHSGKGWQSDNYTYNSIITIFHESFIHVNLGTEDYLDNGDFDDSNINSAYKNPASGYEHHFQHRRVRAEFIDQGAVRSNKLWPNQALNALDRISKSWGLNYSYENLQRMMWKYDGGIEFPK